MTLIPEGNVSAVLACHVYDSCFVFDQDKCLHLLCLPTMTAYIWSLTGKEPCLVIIYLMDFAVHVEALCFLVGSSSWELKEKQF